MVRRLVSVFPVVQEKHVQGADWESQHVGPQARRSICVTLRQEAAAHPLCQEEPGLPQRCQGQVFVLKLDKAGETCFIFTSW